MDAFTAHSFYVLMHGPCLWWPSSENFAVWDNPNRPTSGLLFDKLEESRCDKIVFAITSSLGDSENSCKVIWKIPMEFGEVSFISILIFHYPTLCFGHVWLAQNPALYRFSSDHFSFLFYRGKSITRRCPLYFKIQCTACQILKIQSRIPWRNPSITLRARLVTDDEFELPFKSWFIIEDLYMCISHQYRCITMHTVERNWYCCVNS